MFIGILGILLFLSSIVWLLISSFKRKGLKKPLITLVIGFVLFIVGVSTDTDTNGNTKNDSVASESSSEIKNDDDVVEESKKAPTAKEWVKDHKDENIDLIISDFNTIDDESLKEDLVQSVADSDTTMFDKKVEVTGTAIEFVEGFDGFDKGSFIVETNDGNNVRIAAKTPNEALDIGEKVEVKGVLATPLNSTEEYLVREASVYIQ